ncbi:class I SAM-dependent methyltransferase [Pseudonocardia sp. CA-107938]|uniref:class I SAM-dependent methyltransferase n=1 Tax=Pseudonocardia sp. CA-107938 TaxID=3240021 RepID=UPI003D8E8325
MPTPAHERRDVAESFGTDAERYDRARPAYPQQLIERIVAASPGPDVLDVGCGTGISARQLRAAGARVLGLDVDERMVGPARRSGLAVEVGAFEEWDPAGRTFDAVVSGQAWHWVDPVRGAAQAARVLRPGGRIALFWNVAQPPPDLTAAFAAVYQRVLPELPAYGGSMLAVYEAGFGPVEDALVGAGFGTPERWRAHHEITYTRAEWLDVVPTHGGHGRLAPDRLAELLDGLGAAVDDAGGAFAMRYDAVAVTATLPT